MKNFDNFNYKSDAVAKFKEIYGKEEEFKEISLSSVIVLPQVRTEFEPESISELAESIKKIGVIQPVVVVSLMDLMDGYRLVIGERRFRASRLAGNNVIPARIFRNLSEEEITVLQLIENIHREDLKPMELAQSYKKLQDGGMSTRDIAELVKKSQAHIVNTLKLLTLDNDLKDKVAKEGLSPSKAVEYSKLAKPARKDVDIKTIKRDELRNIRKSGEAREKDKTSGASPYKPETPAPLENRDIDALIEEFNLKSGNITIAKEKSGITIFSADRNVLFDIVYDLKKKYCK